MRGRPPPLVIVFRASSAPSCGFFRALPKHSAGPYFVFPPETFFRFSGIQPPPLLSPLGPILRFLREISPLAPNSLFPFDSAPPRRMTQTNQSSISKNAFFFPPPPRTPLSYADRSLFLCEDALRKDGSCGPFFLGRIGALPFSSISDASSSPTLRDTRSVLRRFADPWPPARLSPSPRDRRGAYEVSPARSFFAFMFLFSPTE